MPIAPAGSSTTRRDIQGLRAVAVLAVVVFHIWPPALTGGYVGVDVFFVISGFLITSHLLREPPVTRRRLGRFWARRIRRLLPAASGTLLITLVASWWWLPETRLAATAREGRAAALYFENWQLARTAANYLTADSAPSPIQHYWSLSVEEQFYLFWPLLIAALALLGRQWLRRSGAARESAVFAVGFGAVFAASLGCSWWYTAADPARAYFVTPTRIWELALGALTALAGTTLVRRRRALRVATAWAGLLLVAVSAFHYGARTAFPGLAALVPTGGAALVLLADVDALPWSPRGLLGNRVAVFLGDISYSLYLWHWPVVVLGPFALGHEPGHWAKLGFLALSVVLASLSKRFVEDPIRYTVRLRGRTVRTYAVGASLMALVVLLSAGQLAAVRDRAEWEGATAEAAERSSDPCFGARAAMTPGCDLAGPALHTGPLMAAGDLFAAGLEECFSEEPFTRHERCTFGAQNAPRRIALLGNSHAGSWFPLVESVAESRGWRLDTYLSYACWPAEHRLTFDGPGSQGCLDWTNWARREIEQGRYAAVVVTAQSGRGIAGVAQADKFAVATGSYRQILQDFLEAGVKVLVIRDTPNYPQPVPDCVAAQGDTNWRSGCDRPAGEVLPLDPLAAAAAALPPKRSATIDITGLLCPGGTCRAVIGGVITQRDHQHLTQTYVRSLKPLLWDRMLTALS